MDGTRDSHHKGQTNPIWGRRKAADVYSFSVVMFEVHQQNRNQLFRSFSAFKSDRKSLSAKTFIPSLKALKSSPAALEVL